MVDQLDWLQNFGFNQRVEKIRKCFAQFSCQAGGMIQEIQNIEQAQNHFSVKMKSVYEVLTYNLPEHELKALFNMVQTRLQIIPQKESITVTESSLFELTEQLKALLLAHEQKKLELQQAEEQIKKNFFFNDQKAVQSINQIKMMMQDQKPGKVLDNFQQLLTSMQEDRQRSTYLQQYIAATEEIKTQNEDMHKSYAFGLLLAVHEFCKFKEPVFLKRSCQLLDLEIPLQANKTKAR